MTPEKLVSIDHGDSPIAASQLTSITPLAITTSDPTAVFELTGRPAVADIPTRILARHHGEHDSDSKAWRWQSSCQPWRWQSQALCLC